jgi:hypothetical protein
MVEYSPHEDLVSLEIDDGDYSIFVAAHIEDNFVFIFVGGVTPANKEIPTKSGVSPSFLKS